MQFANTVRTKDNSTMLATNGMKMDNDIKVSKAKIRDLTWVFDNQPFSEVPKSGPNLVKINQYVNEGLVEKANVEPHPKLRNIGVSVYKLTRMGRKFLKQNLP